MREHAHTTVTFVAIHSCPQSITLSFTHSQIRLSTIQSVGFRDKRGLRSDGLVSSMAPLPAY